MVVTLNAYAGVEDAIGPKVAIKVLSIEFFD